MSPSPRLYPVLADPCGTELCLSDFDAAKQIKDCKPHLDEFFSIIRTHHGKFSPSRTFKARRDYLYKCESDNIKEKEAILAVFGAIYKPSY